MINLSEFLTQGSIFTSINAIKPLPFLDGGQALVMDRMLSLQYGDKTLFSKMVTLSLPEIAEMLVVENGDNWDAMILFSDELRTIPRGKTRTLTETVNDVENSVNVTDNKNVVSAFNSDELIVNDGMLGNVANDTTNAKTRELVDTTSSLWDSQNVLSLSEKNNIMNTVLNDVVNYLTINIY